MYGILELQYFYLKNLAKPLITSFLVGPQMKVQFRHNHEHNLVTNIED